MVRNRNSISFLLKFLLGVTLTVGCFSSLTTGIVVRLGDSGVSYRSSATAFASDHQLGITPHLLSSPRLKYPPISIPLAYVFRQLPFLASYTRHNSLSLASLNGLPPAPVSLNGLPPAPVSPNDLPPAPVSPNVLPPAPISPNGLPPAPISHNGLLPAPASPASWADHSPLPFYPLTPSQPPSESIPTESNTRHQQRIQLPSAQLQSEIVPVSTPIPKKVVSKEKNVAGRPGIDYPTYGEIPQTSFSCKDQRYKGFFGDPETRCQAWHYCDFNGGQASFLCPNGTIFSQVLLTCDWWFNVHCNSTLQLYVINERLYKYIIPMVPSFPEDFQGPEVNQYLTLKFMELMQKEEKKLKEKKLKEAKEQNDKSEELDDLGSNAGDDDLLNRQYLIQSLSNDLGNKERDSQDSKNGYLSQ